uniref:Uncharacterized protein n=1 Tax=Leersia perrieri TaxID=77586 RepID=A0A0D9WCG7_9ORYZ
MRGNFGDKNKNKNKTMCNNHSGSVHHHPVKCVLDDALRFSVECACRFIEKEDLGILDNGTGDRDANSVSIPYSSQTVSNYDSGSVCHDPVKSFLHNPFRFGVQSASRFI